MDDVRVTSCSAEDEQAAGEEEWLGLARADPEASVYLTPFFLRTYARHRPSWEPPLRLLLARRGQGGALVGLLPYSAGRGGGRVGDPGYLMQRRGALLAPGSPSQRQLVLQALCDRLCDEPWPWLEVRTLLPAQASDLSQCLLREGIVRGLRPSLRSPYLSLPASWDAYLGSRSRAMREVLTSRARRLERKHRTEVVVLTHKEQVRAAWQEIQQVARHSWSHRQGTSLLTPTGPERMFGPLLDAAAGADALWLGLLRLDGQPVAVEIDLLWNGVVYVQKPFYDERLAALSPGQYLMGKMIQRTIESSLESSREQRGPRGSAQQREHDAPRGPLREYDLGGGDEPYKLRFADEVRKHVTLWAYRKQAGALLRYLARHHVLPFVRGRWGTGNRGR